MFPLSYFNLTTMWGLKPTAFASTVIPCQAMRDADVCREVLTRFTNVIRPEALEICRINQKTMCNYYPLGYYCDELDTKYFVLFDKSSCNFTLFAPALQLGLCLVVFRKFIKSEIVEIIGQFGTGSKNDITIHKSFKLGIRSILHYYEHCFLDNYSMRMFEHVEEWNKCGICDWFHHPALPAEFNKDGADDVEICQNRKLTMAKGVELFVKEKDMTRLLKLFKAVKVSGYSSIAAMSKFLFENTLKKDLLNPKISQYTIGKIMERYSFLDDELKTKMSAKLNCIFVSVQEWLVDNIKSTGAYGRPYGLKFELVE